MLANLELSRKYDKTASIISKEKSERPDKNDLRDDKILESVVKNMIDEESFLNQDIKISDVAEKIEINEKYLSKAINSITDDNFNNLVNFFRVMHVKDLFESGEYINYTIEALGHIAGFKHKATFTPPHLIPYSNRI